MNFERYNTEPNIQPYKKKASTALARGQAVFQDSNGFIDKAIETTAADLIIGAIMEDIAATDSDYASTREVMVDIARKGDNGDWFMAEVETGTPAQTHVGESHDLTAAGKVDLTATSTLVVKVQRIISATKVLVTFMDGDAT